MLKAILFFLARGSAKARLTLAEISLQAIDEAIAKASADDRPYLERKRQRAQMAVTFAQGEVDAHAFPFDSSWWA